MARPTRSHPVHGVRLLPDRTAVVFVTICADRHQQWPALDTVCALCLSIWLDARGWLVGQYLLMPDHLHFFATPGEWDCSLEQWSKYWKRQFTLALPDGYPHLQVNHWDTRMRNGSHFADTLAYMRMNPVRRGLVSNPDEWPYQGRVHAWIYEGP